MVIGCLAVSISLFLHLPFPRQDKAQKNGKGMCKEFSFGKVFIFPGLMLDIIEAEFVTYTPEEM
jgi:hypothetical protein